MIAEDFTENNRFPFLPFLPFPPPLHGSRVPSARRESTQEAPSQVEMW